MQTITTLFIFVLVATALGDTPIPCTFTHNGQTYDFSSLSNPDADYTYIYYDKSLLVHLQEINFFIDIPRLSNSG